MAKNIILQIRYPDPDVKDYIIRENIFKNIMNSFKELKLENIPTKDLRILESFLSSVKRKNYIHKTKTDILNET